MRFPYLRRRKHPLTRFAQWLADAWRRFIQWLVYRWKRSTGYFRRQAVMARMQKADIVLASPPTRRLPPIGLVYRLLLGTRYVHTMLYIGGGKVIHTTGSDGVVVGRLPRKIYDPHRYSIFRVRGLKAEARAQVVDEALSRLDTQLDLIGMLGVVFSRVLRIQRNLGRWRRSRIWCSRLILEAFQSAGVELAAPERADTITSEDISRNPRLRRIQVPT